MAINTSWGELGGDVGVTFELHLEVIGGVDLAVAGVLCEEVQSAFGCH